MGVHVCNISLLRHYQHTSSKLVKIKLFISLKETAYHCSIFSYCDLFHRYGYKLINKQSNNCGSFAGCFLLDGKPELFTCILMLTLSFMEIACRKCKPTAHLNSEKVNFYSMSKMMCCTTVGLYDKAVNYMIKQQAVMTL